MRLHNYIFGGKTPQLRVATVVFTVAAHLEENLDE